MKVCLERYKKREKQTDGELFVYDDDGELVLHLFTLELPDKNNERRVSCIPEGVYSMKKHRSPKFKNSFWIQDVPGRSEILIHAGNYHHQILGCVLVGTGRRDINGDGLPDVLSSRKAVQKLYDVLPAVCDIDIQYLPGVKE